MHRLARAALCAALFLFSAFFAYPDELPQDEWVKGGVVTGLTLEGKCAFKPFIKVGDAEDDDDGDHRVLGYTPGEVVVDSQGRVVWERVKEDRFVPLHGWKTVHGRFCKCPPYNE